MLIQPIGKVVIEFLKTNFHDIFNYEFTQEMENSLDLICKGEENFINVSRKIDNLIESLIGKVDVEEKDSYILDDHHSLINGRYGPVIKVTNGELVSFKSIKKDISIDSIKKGKYALDDIIDKSDAEKQIGHYKNKDVYIKKGKWGFYAKWGDCNQSLKSLNYEKIEDIKFNDIIELLENNNYLREINSDCTIRKGPKGNYIYYKTNRMKKPAFYNIKKFSNDYINCPIDELKNWINTTYNLHLE